MQNRAPIFLLVTLLLSGCFSVEDFGGYWEKARQDKDLIGIWVEQGGDGEKMEIKPLKHNAVVADKATVVKSIQAGKYRYLLARDCVEPYDSVETCKLKPEGQMLRYEYQGYLYVYSIKDEAARKRAGSNPNLSFDEYGITVKRLTPETFTFLESLPNTPEYWEVKTYKRAQ